MTPEPCPICHGDRMLYRGSRRRCCPACVNCDACESDDRQQAEKTRTGAAFILVLLLILVLAIILAALRHYHFIP